MSINRFITIACDGPGCREDAGDPFFTLGACVKWARGAGWSIGKWVLCPACQTPEVRAELRKLHEEMKAVRTYTVQPEEI